MMMVRMSIPTLTNVLFVHGPNNGDHQLMLCAGPLYSIVRKHLPPSKMMIRQVMTTAKPPLLLLLKILPDAPPRLTTAASMQTQSLTPSSTRTQDLRLEASLRRLKTSMWTVLLAYIAQT